MIIVPTPSTKTFVDSLGRKVFQETFKTRFGDDGSEMIFGQDTFDGSKIVQWMRLSRHGLRNNIGRLRRTDSGMLVEMVPH